MFPDVPCAPRRAKLLVLLALLAGASSRVTAQAPSVAAPLPVGINLRPITPYDRAWVFVDALKMASDWRYEDGTATPPTRRTGKGGKPPPLVDDVPLDPSGWPRPTRNRSVSCQFFVGMRGLIPAGEYVCTWKGAGTIEFRGVVGIVSSAPNRIVAQLDGVNGGQPGLKLSGFDANDPIRDIHVWMPGQEDSCHSFHPVLLDRLRPFSVLRFYPWMKVYTTSGRWAQRSTLNSARQSTEEGVAAEYMVELCNELGSDPWFCIPHTADDDYIRQFAKLVRDSLHPDAKVYLEFSNEVWNTDFAAGKWAREQSQLRGVPATQVIAEVAGHLFDLWYEVFGKQSNRIVRVAGAQLHNPGIASEVCRRLNGKFDALAIGAYFGVRPDRDAVDLNSNAAQLMVAARNNLDTVVLPQVAQHKSLVDSLSATLGRHIALISYEGGQSIIARAPGGPLNVDATLQCQDMPEMFDCYRALIDGCSARGVELFVGYDFAGPRGSADTYSVLESITEPLATAPKYRALIQGWETRGQ